MINENNTSGIYKARTIGSLFLIAFLAYGFGRNLFESEAQTSKYIGALLIVTNSIIVLSIGILFRKTLIQYNTMTGNIYFFTRLIEAIALVSLLLNFIPTLSIPNDSGYFFAMLVLGIGSVPMCLTIYKEKLVPNWLALWGTIGYTVFAFGFLMEFFGKKWSMYLLIIGGLWELTFGVWLILKHKKQQDRKTTNH